MEGDFDFSSLNEGIRSLIRMMESVSSGASRTIHNKRCTRIIAISYMIQMGQPLIWLTISPADHKSPIVMKLAGVDIDVTSKLKSDFPDYTEKLRLVASDPVASVQFYLNTIQGVLTCLLRFGASDGDGGEHLVSSSSGFFTVPYNKRSIATEPFHTTERNFLHPLNKCLLHTNAQT